MHYVSVLKGDIIHEYLNQRGLWLLADVEQGIGWPKAETLIVFRDTKIILLPYANDFYPAAAIICPQFDTNLGRKLLENFFSSLAWAYNNRVNVVSWSYSPIRQGTLSNCSRKKFNGQFSQLQTEHFRPTYLPDPGDEKARLALAFYREGLYLNHEGYSFLSFYKIINLKHPDGKKRKEWVNDNLARLENIAVVKKRLDEIKNNGDDPGKYLYKSCRCAIAHAGENPTYDPESAEDNIRLYKDKPLIMNLAKIMIEEGFGVKSLFTIIQEHRYELAGFCNLIGKDITQRLKSGETIGRRSLIINDKISIRLWGHKNWECFQNLTPSIRRVSNGQVELQLSTELKSIVVSVILDFPNEKLLFDPYNGIQCTDDGTIKAANYIADTRRFQAEYLANGVLEIWKMDEEIILGRLNEYIPVNILISETYKNLLNEEKNWRDEALKRSANEIETT
jgi:hypothetical protein